MNIVTKSGNFSPKALTEIVAIEKQIKDLEAKQSEYKEAILAAMTANGVTEFENDEIKLLVIPATEAVILDSKKLKENYSEVYVECTKKSQKKASLRLTIK